MTSVTRLKTRFKSLLSDKMPNVDPRTCEKLLSRLNSRHYDDHKLQSFFTSRKLNTDNMYDKFLAKEDYWGLVTPKCWFPLIEVLGHQGRIARIIDNWHFDHAACFGDKILNDTR